MNSLCFSVVVITYNQERYIARALDSILEQEHEYPYEVIIGEDCSTDGTRDILQKYKEKYPDTIKLLLNEENLGLIKNYFNVVAHCSGKYIMGCAGDDYWLPGKVETQIAFMEDNPDVGLCYGDVLLLSPKGRKEIMSQHRGYVKLEDFAFMYGKYYLQPVSACFRRVQLQEYVDTIKPTEKDWLGEDTPIYAWFAINSKIFYLNILLAVYDCASGYSVSRPKEYEKIKKLVCSVNGAIDFILELYKISYDKEKLDSRRWRRLAALAFKYKQREEYNIYISKLRPRGFKEVVKKHMGKCSWLFNIYWFYSKCRWG